MLGPRPRTPALGVQRLAPHTNPPRSPAQPPPPWGTLLGIPRGRGGVRGKCSQNVPGGPGVAAAVPEGGAVRPSQVLRERPVIFSSALSASAPSAYKKRPASWAWGPSIRKTPSRVPAVRPGRRGAARGPFATPACLWRHLPLAPCSVEDPQRGCWRRPWPPGPRPGKSSCKRAPAVPVPASGPASPRVRTAALGVGSGRQRRVGLVGPGGGV